MAQTPKMVMDAQPIIDPNARTTDILTEQQLAERRAQEAEAKRLNEAHIKQMQKGHEAEDKRLEDEQKAREQQRYAEREQEAERIKERQEAQNKESERIQEGRSLAIDTPMAGGFAQDQAEPEQSAQGERQIEPEAAIDGQIASKEAELTRAEEMEAILAKLEADRAQENELER